jgi:hypothetical protein
VKCLLWSYLYFRFGSPSGHCDDVNFELSLTCVFGIRSLQIATLLVFLGFDTFDFVGFETLQRLRFVFEVEMIAIVEVKRADRIVIL